MMNYVNLCHLFAYQIIWVIYALKWPNINRPTLRSHLRLKSPRWSGRSVCGGWSFQNWIPGRFGRGDFWEGKFENLTIHGFRAYLLKCGRCQTAEHPEAVQLALTLLVALVVMDKHTEPSRAVQKTIKAIMHTCHNLFKLNRTRG